MQDISKDNLLKDYRERFPLKKEIADMIGIHWVTLSKFVNGHHVGPSTLIKIHYFLQISKTVESLPE